MFNVYFFSVQCKIIIIARDDYQNFYSMRILNNILHYTSIYCNNFKIIFGDIVLPVSMNNVHILCYLISHFIYHI